MGKTILGILLFVVLAIPQGVELVSSSLSVESPAEISIFSGEPIRWDGTSCTGEAEEGICWSACGFPGEIQNCDPAQPCECLNGENYSTEECFPGYHLRLIEGVPACFPGYSPAPEESALEVYCPNLGKLLDGDLCGTPFPGAPWGIDETSCGDIVVPCQPVGTHVHVSTQ